MRLNTLPALLLSACLSVPVAAQARATVMQTPYLHPKALFDIYLDHPAKMGAALYWLRSFVNPLLDAPYSFFNDDMSVIVVLHGTELVHWQNQGYGLITPAVTDKKLSIEAIR